MKFAQSELNELCWEEYDFGQLSYSECGYECEFSRIRPKHVFTTFVYTMSFFGQELELQFKYTGAVKGTLIVDTDITETDVREIIYDSFSKFHEYFLEKSVGRQLYYVDIEVPNPSNEKVKEILRNIKEKL